MRAASLVRMVPDRPLTEEEWFDLPEDQPEELVDGALVEAEMPGWVHETVVVWLLRHLDPWARAHGAFVAGSGIKYRLRAFNGRMPDLSLFLAGRRPPPQGLVRIPPDLAVEVISPNPANARRDRVEKMQDYAAFGIRWYWLLDPELRTFEVLELRDGAYAHVGAAATGPVSEIPGFDGLELDLDPLWAEVDALSAPEPDEAE